MKDDSLVFLEIAFQDLNVSKELLSKGYNTHSIYFLQQSIEKMVKYVGLTNSTIEKSELVHSISHKTSKIFKKAIKDYWDKAGFTSENELFQTFNNISETYASEEDEIIIPEIVELIHQFNSSTEVDFPFPDFNNPEDLIKFVKENDVNQEIELTKLEDIISNPTYSNVLKTHMTNMLPTVIEYVKGLQVLFILTGYFESFVTKVRYPTEDFENPANTFTSEHILVKHLPFFHSEADKSLKRLQKTAANKI